MYVTKLNDLIKGVHSLFHNLYIIIAVSLSKCCRNNNTITILLLFLTQSSQANFSMKFKVENADGSRCSDKEGEEKKERKERKKKEALSKQSR